MARDRTRTVPILPPRLEGTLRLGDGRSIGFAEYGAATGRPVFWFHGTPGGRHQVPPQARLRAAERGVRIVALERPGIGGSTPTPLERVRDWSRDVAEVADQMDFDRFGLVGLSGGGPFVLACAHDLPHRVVGGAVLGGVAPSRGPEAVAGGAVGLAAPFERLLTALREPLGGALHRLIRGLVPVRHTVFDLYLMTVPEGDRLVMGRPEMREMFIGDLVGCSEDQLRAPFYDLAVFTREWGFSLRDVRVPIRFWHGDADNIVPLAHSEHQVELVSDGELRVRAREGHLGSLDAAEEILDTLLELWDRPVLSAVRSGRSTGA